MSSPFFGLDIALTGLFTSQIQLNTATHNISNAETEGYTRQNVATQAADAMQTGSRVGMVGTGVVATDISQVRNEYYDIKYWKDGFSSAEEIKDDPKKVIGRYMSKEDAELEVKKGNYVVEEPGKGYRRAIAAPKPIDIVEIDAIKALSDADQVVISN